MNSGHRPGMALSKRILLAGVLALVPGWGLAWRAYNTHVVVPVSQTVFEVVGRPGSSAANYWCSAGDYVRHRLRMKATTRIYIWQAIGPSVSYSNSKAVQFSLNSPVEPPLSPGYSLSVKAVGDNLTAAAAYQYCLGNSRVFPF